MTDRTPRPPKPTPVLTPADLDALYRVVFRANLAVVATILGSIVFVVTIFVGLWLTVQR